MIAGFASRLSTVNTQKQQVEASASDDEAHNLCYTCTFLQMVYADNEERIGSEDCLTPTSDSSSEIARVECTGYCTVSSPFALCICNLNI